MTFSKDSSCCCDTIPRQKQREGKVCFHSQSRVLSILAGRSRWSQRIHRIQVVTVHPPHLLHPPHPPRHPQHSPHQGNRKEGLLLLRALAPFIQSRFPVKGPPNRWAGLPVSIESHGVIPACPGAVSRVILDSATLSIGVNSHGSCVT